jgi:hypothetical protein
VHNLPEIPPRLRELPSPGKTSIQPDEAKRRVDSAMSELKPKTDHKAWARRVVANPQAFSAISLAFAKKALSSDG